MIYVVMFTYGIVGALTAAHLCIFVVTLMKAEASLQRDMKKQRVIK